MEERELRKALGEAISGLDWAAYEARRLGRDTLAKIFNDMFDKLDDIERGLH